MGDIIQIGSRAANVHGFFRDPLDFDFIAKYEDIMPLVMSLNGSTKPKQFYPTNKGKKIIAQLNNGKMVEIEIAWSGSIAEQFIEMVKSDPNTVQQGFDGTNTWYTPSLNVLYMLKLSHRYLKNNPHFIKTMSDIHKMREMGAVFPEEYRDWFKKREDETYWYKHPNLKQDKRGFFTDDVPYTYDHDSIHEAIKLNEKPAYQYFAKDGEEVLSDKTKFFKLPKDIQLSAGYEESCVLAIERALVPFPDGMDSKQAFDYALMKVCTSITSGWFREYCWEHYSEIKDLYMENPDYFEKFKIGLEKGIVKPHISV